MSASRLVGVDIGGTFTDIAALDPVTGDLRVCKVPSIPGNLERGVVDGLGLIRSVGGDGLGEIRHGTTIVTNALLERRLARTALLCTRGFRDILDRRRLWRERLFGYDWERPESLISRSMRFEVDERIGPSGEVIRPLDEDQVRRLALRLGEMRVEAIAVAYLFSFRNATHEARTAAILTEHLPHVPVSVSSEILPEIHEYERTSTTAINALVQPEVLEYLSTIEASLNELGVEGPLRMVRSDGTLLSPAVAAREPVRLVHSGPAVGVTGAARLGERLGWRHAVTLDMGGTSTDVALIWDGQPLRTFETDVEWNIPIKTTQIDIQSIGAGGGSLVGMDVGGRLFVGPESAGASPGPVCYGRGGKQPTLTDALLGLGLLPAELLGGDLPLDVDAAGRALLRAVPDFETVREAADAIYTVTLHKMAVLTREVTINRGYDPRQCVLVCFGGAGALFAADLVRELSMKSAYVPPAASVFSALGACMTRVSYEAIDGLYAPVESLDIEALRVHLRALQERAGRALDADGLPLDSLALEVDLKYRAQPETLTIPLRGDLDNGEPLGKAVAEFHDSHAQRFALRREDEPVDLVTLRAIAFGPQLESWPLTMAQSVARLEDPSRHRRTWFRDGQEIADVLVLAWSQIEGVVDGPLFIEDAYTTIAVPPGVRAQRDDLGGIRLEVHE